MVLGWLQKLKRSQAQGNTRKTAILHTHLLGHFGNAHDTSMAVSVLCPPTVQKPPAKSFVTFIDTANFTAKLIYKHCSAGWG